MASFQAELSGNPPPHPDIISKFSHYRLVSRKSLSICTKIAVMKNVSKILGNFVLKRLKTGWVSKKF